MKKLLIIGFLAALVYTGYSQNPTATKDQYRYSFCDTLRTGADSTLFFTIPLNYASPYDYNLAIVADSLAGATAAAAYLEQDAGIKYIPLSGKSLTIDGVSSSTNLNGTIFTGKIRVRFAKGAGYTQQTRVRATITLQKSALAYQKVNLDAGALSGITTMASTGAQTITTDGDVFTVNMGTTLKNLDLSINSSSKWSVDSTGKMIANGGAAIAGAVTSINASSNYATNIGTGTTNAAVSIGGGSNTVAVNSTTWDVSTAGAVSGVTSLASTGTQTVTTDGDVYTVNMGTALTPIDLSINSASKFSVDSTGKGTFAGGIVLPSASSHIWSTGGSANSATAGTDVTPVAATRYWVGLEIPYNVTLTGISYLIGSVGGTDSVVIQLFNSAGIEVATTRSVGGAAALVGTAANMQGVNFTTPYAAVAGKYYVAVQFSGTTCRFRAYPIPGCKFITGSAAGVWRTKADITPGTTYTADKGPIIQTY